MGVDEAGEDDFVGRVDDAVGRLIVWRKVGGAAEPRDAVVLYEKCTILELGAIVVHCDELVGMSDEDGCH